MTRLQVKIFNLGELQNNCYLIWSETSKTAVIIDPADSGDVLSEFILAENLDLAAVLLTHGHFDHCLGLLELQLNFEAASYIHPEDVFLISKAQKSAQYWLKHSVDPIPLPSHRFQDTDQLDFSDFSIKILATPGHTPGSVCLQLIPKTLPETTAIFIDNSQLYPGTSCIFTGDTLFTENYPRTDHTYSSVLQLNESWQKLKMLDPHTTFLPGHGEYGQLGRSLLYPTESPAISI